MELSEDQKNRILEMLSEGKTCLQVREEIGLTANEFRKLRKQDPKLDAEIQDALEHGYDEMADQLLMVSDEYSDPARARLKSDNVKWVLSKRRSQIYGDKVSVDMKQTVDISAAISEARARVSLPTCYPAETRDVQEVDIFDDSLNTTSDYKSDVETKAGAPGIDEML